MQCLVRNNQQPRQQPLPLLARERNHLARLFCRPFKGVLFKPLVPQCKASFIPINDFKLVTFSVAEHKHLPAEYVTLHFLLDNGSETINGFSEIHWLSMQLHRFTLPADHDSDLIKAATQSGDVAAFNCKQLFPYCRLIVLEASIWRGWATDLAATNADDSGWACLNFLSWRKK